MNDKFGRSLRFISPRYLATYLLFFSILMTFIPKDLYEKNLHERMSMQGNPSLYLLLIFSTGFFLIGAWTVEKISFPNDKSSETIKVNKLAYYFPQLLSLCGSFILLNALQKSIGIYFLLQNSLSNASPGLRYSVFKVMGDSNLSWVTPVSYFAIVSGFWYIKVSRSVPVLDKLIYILSLSLSILGAFLQLSKAPIISIIILIFSCHVIISSYLNTLNMKKLLINSIGIAILIAIMFYILQTQRYSSIAGNGITQFLGYFPASYNRLSVLLDGRLVMPAGDGFYYTNLGLWAFPIIGGVARGLFGAFMGISIPSDGFEIWYKSFEAVNMAGLNRNFIWITTYGEAFQDYGWFAPIWFYIYGVFMGVFWKLLLQRNNIGLFVYPILMLTMQWWSIASIFGRDTMIVVFIAIVSKALLDIKMPKLVYTRS